MKRILVYLALVTLFAGVFELAIVRFAVLIYSGTAIFTWMRMRSGSLWAGVFLHGSHNIVIQGVLTPITVNTGKTAWAIDEFGIAVPAVMLLLAVYFWTRRGELPAKAAVENWEAAPPPRR